MVAVPSWSFISLGLVAACALLGGAGCAHDEDTEKKAPPAKEATSVSIPFSKKPAAHALVVLHTSDNESDILGSAASSKDPSRERRGGIGRAVSIMRALRASAAAPVLTVASGDTLMPAPELKVEIGRENAVAKGNNLLGYDVSALGNHEFDNGETYLAGFIRQANFPYLSASVTVNRGPLKDLHVGGGKAPAPEDTPWAGQIPGKVSTRALLCAGKLKQVEGQKPVCDGKTVGVVGATTERLRMLSSVTDAVDVKDTLEGVRDAIQAEVDVLRANGVDVIFLLSHLQDVNKELKLIELGLVGIDVVVAGGGDDRLANAHHRLLDGETRPALCDRLPLGGEGLAGSCYPLLRVATDGKPVAVVATDGQLKYIGRLEVSFDDEGVLTGVNTARSRPWPVDEMSLLELRADLDKEALAFETSVRDYLAPLMQTIATSSAFLDGTRESVRNHETNLGNLSSDAMMAAAKAFARKEERNGVRAPAFAVRNGGGIRASIGYVDATTSERKGGPIRKLDVESALRFDNELMLVTTTHQVLRSTLESALRGVGTGRGSFPHFSSEVEMTFHPGGAEQTHEVVDGKIVAVKCPGGRVRSLTVTPNGGKAIPIVAAGVTVTPSQSISFVTLKYMANGGDGAFPAASDKVKAVAIGATEQSSLVGFLADEIAAGTWKDGANYQHPFPADPSTFKRVKAVEGPPPPPPADCPAP